MIRFVNAKINIGLDIVAKRPDGYHELQTVFFPVGLECGLPHQSFPFDDILEVTHNDKEAQSGCRFKFMGRKIDCPPKKNLVVRAASEFLRNYNANYNDLQQYGMFEITLDKHLPDGAGLGGGSADAAFTISMLNEVTGKKFSGEDLSLMALKVGADCPFFLINRPCYAKGVGEILTPIDLDLKGYTILIVKPDVYISTAEAFSGVTPETPEFNLQELPSLPVEEWKYKVKNDFEATVFSRHPQLGELKRQLYDSGAIYASMSGSGSAIYGIYADSDIANQERERLKSTYQAIWLFGM